MNARLYLVSSAILIGAALVIAANTACAENNTASKHAALHKACTEQGGRFETSWIYDDQGVQWGKVLSCSTSAGYIRCQANVCRSGRWIFNDSQAVANSRPSEDDSVAQFHADPAAFSAALAALTVR